MLSPVNFTGLTKNFSRQPYDKLSVMKTLAVNSDSQIAGELPSDIINEIVKNNPNSNVKEAIKELYASLANCANILQEVFLATNETVEKINFSELFEDIFFLQSAGNLWEANKFVEKTFMNNENVIETEKMIIERAQAVLKQACKKIGLIPLNGNIKIYSLGQGSFGAAYQIRFLNEINQDVIHSKVIKVFPLKKEELEATVELKAAKNALFNLIANDSLPIEENQYEYLKEEARKKFSEKCDSFAKFQRGIRPEIDMEDIHGFLPETNRGLYINKKLGKNNIRSNFAPFYYSDLRNNFFITEMVDRDLQYTDKSYELRDLGLNNTDGNRHNTICSRLVDYGGLQTLGTKALSDNSYYEYYSSW